MKFNMDASIVKEIAAKMEAISKVKSVMSITSAIRIEAAGKEVQFFIANMESTLRLVYKSAVEESGVCYVSHDGFKKFGGMTGNLVIESGSGRLNAKAVKKKAAVPSPAFHDEDMFHPFYNDSDVERNKLLAVTNEQELLSAMSDMSTFTSPEEINKLMQCFYFDAKAKRIVALDGHRIGAKNLSWNFPADSFTLHRESLTQLKKVLDKKSGAEVKIYDGGKYIVIDGAGFSYTMHKVDGAYFKYSQMLVENIPGYESFTLNNNDLAAAVKEYIPCIKAEKKPMFMARRNNTIKTGIVTAEYETVDDISSEGKGRDFIMGVNPIFISDALKLITDRYVKARMVIAGAYQKAPIELYNDVYTMLILPVNIQANGNTRFEQMIRE